MADKSTNLKYRYMRLTHSYNKGQANGYRSHAFFLREQKIILSLLNSIQSPILDLACGSGIMLSPLLNTQTDIIGLDYNENACISAKSNRIYTLRGDAFCLPIKENSISQVINCQFLNQQTQANAAIFVDEITKVLTPGGQAIILWRNSNSLLHRVSHFLLSIADKIKGAPIFPQFKHTIKELKEYSNKNELEVTFEAVSLPVSRYSYVSLQLIYWLILSAHQIF